MTPLDKVEIPLSKLKAQYNPKRVKFWKQLHVGPKEEVFNMKYSPHYRFLQAYDENHKILENIKTSPYYKMHILYGKTHNWTMDKINKFINNFNDIKKNGIKEEVEVNKISENEYEIYEGHHRVSIWLYLGHDNIICKIR